jgi:hypothetical protein
MNKGVERFYQKHQKIYADSELWLAKEALNICNAENRKCCGWLCCSPNGVFNALFGVFLLTLRI